MKYNKALVTGGAGFIGSHMVEQLLAKGIEVSSVDNLTTGRSSNMLPGAKYHDLDLRSQQLLALLEEERPEVVFHMAAQSSVARSMTNPGDDAQINVVGSVNLLEACRITGVDWFVYSSTGGALYGNPTDLPCGENHAVRPISAYGASKFAFETYLDCYRQVYGFKSSILRYSNVYGPRQDPHGEAGVVAIFSLKMLAGESPVIFGDGLQERDFVYVGDVVAANIAVVEHQIQDTFNIGLGEPTNVNTIYDLLRGLIGFDQPPAYEPARAGEVYKIHLDVEKAKRLLRWEPQVSLIQGLKEVVAHERACIGQKTVARPPNVP